MKLLTLEASINIFQMLCYLNDTPTFKTDSLHLVSNVDKTGKKPLTATYHATSYSLPPGRTHTHARIRTHISAHTHTHTHANKMISRNQAAWFKNFKASTVAIATCMCALHV